MSYLARIDLVRLRLPILLISFILIFYNTLYLVFFVPYHDSTASATWQPDNVYRVIFVLEEETELQVGDVIEGINGRPARQSLWRPLFSPNHLPQTTFTVARDGRQFTVTWPTMETSILRVLNRLKTTAVALVTWLMAAPIILFAARQNRRAWVTGLFFIFFAVNISAIEARIVNVPGAHLLAAFAPILGVVFARLPLIAAGAPSGRRLDTLFRLLYLLAGSLICLNLIEIFWLFPQGSSFEILTGLSLFSFSALVVAAGLLANFIVLIGLALTLSEPFKRRQALTLLTFTGLAIIPLVFLSAVPLALLNESLLPPWLAFLLLGLIPAGYGFVIYRRQYLALEFFVTRTLTILILGLLMAALYLSVVYIFSRSLPDSQFNPLYNLAAFSIAFIVVPIAGRPTHHALWMLIFGQRAAYDDYLAQITAELSANLQHITLEKAMAGVAELLQVRQAALLLVNNRERLVGTAYLRTDPLPPLKLNTNLLADGQPRSPAAWQQATQGAAPLPEWAALAVPLTVRESLAGLLLLGLPLPDGYFNAAQIAFIGRIAATMGVASETVRLFESSLMMSRELLEVQDAERAQIAAQIHDEPLQQITLVTNALERLLVQANGNAPEETAVIRRQKEALQQIIRQLRNICAGLRPPILHQGIEWLVREVVYDFQNNSQIEAVLELDISDTLDPDEKTLVAVYHILLESLNNVRKHAQASRVTISLREQSGEISLRIADNGRGSRLDNLSLTELVRRHHFGLVGMMEWAALAGGRLEIDQGQDGGMVVLSRIPV